MTEEETADLSTPLPRISCEDPGFEGLHAALFTESRMRGRRQQREVGNWVRFGRDNKRERFRGE